MIKRLDTLLRWLSIQMGVPKKSVWTAVTRLTGLDAGWSSFQCLRWGVQDGGS